MVSWNIKAEKNLRSVLAREHAKLGLVKMCWNSIMLTSKRDNLDFSRERLKLDTFVFLVKQKVYYTIPLFSDTLRVMCSGNKWYKVKYLGNNGKRVIFFFTALIIVSRIKTKLMDPSPKWRPKIQIVQY